MLYVVQTSFSGQATSPTPHSQPTSTPTATPPPADNLMLPLADAPTWHEWNLNMLQAACRQASTNWKELNAKIKSVSLYLSATPRLYLLQSSPLGARLRHAIGALLLCGATSISSKLHLKRAGCV